MEKPWALHPYQYVEQNPIIYWDGNGQQPLPPPGEWAPDGQPFSCYIGHEIHKAIAEQYRLQHPNEEVHDNTKTLLHIIKAAGIDPRSTGILRELLALKPDIFNITTGDLYEIKPFNDQYQARLKMEKYVRYLNKAGVAARPGDRFALGVVGVVPAPGGIAIYWSSQRGVIAYSYHRRILMPVRQPAEVLEPAQAKAKSTSQQRASDAPPAYGPKPEQVLILGAVLLFGLAALQVMDTSH